MGSIFTASLLRVGPVIATTRGIPRGTAGRDAVPVPDSLAPSLTRGSRGRPSDTPRGVNFVGGQELAKTNTIDTGAAGGVQHHGDVECGRGGAAPGNRKAPPGPIRRHRPSGGRHAAETRRALETIPHSIGAAGVIRQSESTNVWGKLCALMFGSGD